MTLTEWAYFQCDAIRAWEARRNQNNNADGWTQRIKYVASECSLWYSWICTRMSVDFPGLLYVSQSGVNASTKMTSEQKNFLNSLNPIPPSWIKTNGESVSIVTGSGTTFCNPAKDVVCNLMGVGVFAENQIASGNVNITVQTTLDGTVRSPFSTSTYNKIKTVVESAGGTVLNTYSSTASSVTYMLA